MAKTRYSLGAMLICALFAATGMAGAQTLQALARLDVPHSAISAKGGEDVEVRLKLTQAVPYRVLTLADPPRLVIDFREVNFAGASRADLVRTDRIGDLRHGLFRPGWSRMVLELLRPMSVLSAGMETDPNDGDALVLIRLTPADAASFARASVDTASDLWGLPEIVDTPPAKTRPQGDRPVVVALDPGHGGIDPGAQYGGLSEADLVLTLARELKERLVLSGRYEVIMTRQEDTFLSLENRVSLARAGGADVFISLHADALAEGRASGTTVYTLAETATDAASQALAAGHERGDLLAGVDLSQQDDLIASILMDMARLETAPRSEKLADELVAGIAETTGRIRSRPRLSAAFSVLKAPDIPSVLIEFGFMSNPVDLANLTNPEWRREAIDGILLALDRWSLSDAAEARLLRQ